MALDQLISKLLYVPFNEDYKVIQEIKDKLTEKIFFDECFVLPAFDEEIQNALNGTGDEVDDFEMDLDKKEIINKLQKRQEKFDSLKAWVESGQSDIYCIRGDAGTGKSTFLHYLKNQYINDNIIFEIVDIQKATVVISVLGKSITIPKFSSLYFKAISAILHNIFDTLYIRENNGKVKYKETYQNAIRINSLYNNNFKDYYPREETTDFFSMLTKNIVSSEDYRYNCEMIADNIESWTEQILNNNSLDEQTKFSIVLEILIYYLNCNKNAPRHIIAFDNFERFIGTDEIYDDQLTEFVSYLRTVQKAIASNNIPIKGTYQIIIFMRNTSVRMFTSQQITEFFSHDIDLSDWFDVGSVVKKK